MRNIHYFLLLLLLHSGFMVVSQTNNNKKLVYDPELNQYISPNNTPEAERTLRYTPDGEDFVIVNGDKKFNRALYGTHSGFRIETGDVPEFALYLPNMGGNLSFGITNKTKTILLNYAAHIECRYRPGTRIYSITDPILKKGKIVLTALAMSQSEGLILKIDTRNIPSNTTLSFKFGGASDKRFSREGDLGVDPKDCFDLKPEYCKNNNYSLKDSGFELVFGAKQDKKLIGVFPPATKLTVTSDLPILSGTLKLKANSTFYIAIKIPENTDSLIYNHLSAVFNKSEKARIELSSRIKIETPDPFINTLGGTLATAADGIWSGEVWLHGAIGWRMPLSGWRAAYTGDVLGWHDRARKHFDAYAASQVNSVLPVRQHPTQDTALQLARAEKSWGTPMYSNGYICRNPNRNNQMHHYDMNLCYIDELLWHLNWTGDLEYAKKVWPVITESLAWEKRNFDPDNDGLYDAYCCIWASDALYYNSGAVTHATAYNYRANKMAAQLAQKLGFDAQPFELEHTKILKALNNRLWLPYTGNWAEYQDFMGDKKLHESAAIWTVYHAIDSEVNDIFQGYQATRYIDTQIPHIPVTAKGLANEGYATVATSNWLPYAWSINNVAQAEVMHTALAYWQVGRNEEGFKLFKSSILDGMYLGSSPGNVGQISYYDAARGECYRDFGDPIGMTSRAIIQGLYGIIPDLLNDKLIIRPGFPPAWNFANLKTPDINFKFNRTELKDSYSIEHFLKKDAVILLRLKAERERIASVTVNGNPTNWKLIETANGNPEIEIQSPQRAKIEIVWAGKKLANNFDAIKAETDETITLRTEATICAVNDPQKIIDQLTTDSNKLTGKVVGKQGEKTFFVQLTQGQLKWWQPIHLQIESKEKMVLESFKNVDTKKCEIIRIDAFINDSVTRIFKNKYLTPRSPYTTLQLPVQGIGEWCHPLTTADIDDSGFRNSLKNNVLQTSLGVPFKSFATGKNIAFTSRWDNFPRKITIPLTGSASNAYLLMAGTTNHMQSHFVNGKITIKYTDGVCDTLELINPENWCTIEQDYFVDNKAFKLNAPRPYRIHLKTGLVSDNLEKDLNLRGINNRTIPGGAGILLDMPLSKQKQLQSIQIETTANDLIIGLMALTLQR